MATYWIISPVKLEIVLGKGSHPITTSKNVEYKDYFLYELRAVMQTETHLLIEDVQEACILWNYNPQALESTVPQVQNKYVLLAAMSLT